MKNKFYLILGMITLVLFVLFMIRGRHFAAFSNLILAIVFLIKFYTNFSLINYLKERKKHVTEGI